MDKLDYHWNSCFFYFSLSTSILETPHTCTRTHITHIRSHVTHSDALKLWRQRSRCWSRTWYLSHVNGPPTWLCFRSSQAHHRMLPLVPWTCPGTDASGSQCLSSSSLHRPNGTTCFVLCSTILSPFQTPQNTPLILFKQV